MKIISSFIPLVIVMLLIMPFTKATAQGNLQFNRALNYNLTCSGTNYTVVTNTVNITVPAGKVWKIESANISYQASSSPGLYYYPASAFQTALIADQTILTSSFSGSPFVIAPVWLAAGTHTFILQGYADLSTGSGTYTFYGLITGIEFNIQ